MTAPEDEVFRRPQARTRGSAPTRAAFFSLLRQHKIQDEADGQEYEREDECTECHSFPSLQRAAERLLHGSGVLMDDEQNVVASDIQNGVIRQQVILLQTVAVELVFCVSSRASTAARTASCCDVSRSLSRSSSSASMFVCG